VEYPELRTAFQQLGVEKEHRILMVGCGNSKLSEQMYEAGFPHIVSMDISEVVIAQMQAQAQAKGMQLLYQVADATAMPYADLEFDFAIDKGTMDAIICGKNLTLSDRIIREMSRVARHVLLVTYGNPEGRRLVFQSALGLDSHDYLFVKICLSGVSMLINLMRSNLAGKPLKEIIKDKDAFRRTMIEYNIIQRKLAKEAGEVMRICWENVPQGKVEESKEGSKGVSKE
jgi:hypothetical protein